MKFGKKCNFTFNNNIIITYSTGELFRIKSKKEKEMEQKR